MNGNLQRVSTTPGNRVGLAAKLQLTAAASVGLEIKFSQRALNKCALRFLAFHRPVISQWAAGIFLSHVCDGPAYPYWIRLSLCSSPGTHSSVTSRPPARLARRVRDAPPLCSRAECCPTHQTWRRKWWRTTWLCTLSLEPTRYSTLTRASCDTHTYTHQLSACMMWIYVIYKLKDWSHISWASV